MQDTKEARTSNSLVSPVKYSRSRTIAMNALLVPGAGLAASLMAVLIMGLLRLLVGIPTPVELFGDYILKHIDVDTFIRFLRTFEPNSKTAPLGLALLGMIGIGTVVSWLYAALVGLRLPVSGYRPGRREWLTAVGFAVGMTLLGTLLFWDEIRQNLYGFPVDQSRWLTILGLLTAFLVYGATLALCYRALLPKQQSAVSPEKQGRRLLFSRIGVAVLSAGAALGSAGLVRVYLNRYSSYDGSGAPSHNGFPPPITPNDEHYVVTQNTVDPAPNPALWRLEIGGLVKQSGSYTYEEVQKLPSVSRAITLECIANGTGSNLISTAIWQGAALRALLERHGGPLSNATHIAFHSVDGYTISLPLSEVLEADPLLAWQMNGQPLPQRHGFPLRVLMPGRYGEENPKWLTKIELTDHFVSGLYSAQGWYNGPLHTTTRIDRPSGRIAAGEEIEVAGMAFAGNRGIQKVELSTDGGTSWHEATLKPALSQDAWVFWTWQWRSAGVGTYTLLCRATDGKGELQTSRNQGTVPNGATGYHSVNVEVV